LAMCVVLYIVVLNDSTDPERDALTPLTGCLIPFGWHSQGASANTGVAPGPGGAQHRRPPCIDVAAPQVGGRPGSKSRILRVGLFRFDSGGHTDGPGRYGRPL